MATMASDESWASGYLAVLGHRVLGSASVVSWRGGDVATLQRRPLGSQATLEEAIDNSLAAIVEVARTSLVHKHSHCCSPGLPAPLQYVHDDTLRRPEPPCGTKEG